MNQVNQILHNPSSPLEKLQRDYLHSMILRNCSERTIEYWAMNFKRFNAWCHDRGIDELNEITLDVLKSYRQYLFHYRSERLGKPLTFSTQNCYLVVIRRWFTWLYENKILPTDIGQNFQIPKPEQRLPVEFLTADEVESVLNEPDVTTPVGIRDRAMIETFYSTGIRCSELLNLQLYDLDAQRGVIVIRYGKGKKERIVPIGDRALLWANKYIADARLQLMQGFSPHPYLFVNTKGRKLVRGSIAMTVRRYMNKAGIKKKGSCHLLRHTAATLMMENGADLRSLQQYLGHARITTTQVYTHVSIAHLQKVHAKTHPASSAPKHEPDDDGEAAIG